MPERFEFSLKHFVPFSQKVILQRRGAANITQDLQGLLCFSLGYLGRIYGRYHLYFQ